MIQCEAKMNTYFFLFFLPCYHFWTSTKTRKSGQCETEWQQRPGTGTVLSVTRHTRPLSWVASTVEPHTHLVLWTAEDSSIPLPQSLNERGRESQHQLVPRTCMYNNPQNTNTHMRKGVKIIQFLTQGVRRVMEVAGHWDTHIHTQWRNTMLWLTCSVFCLTQRQWSATRKWNSSKRTWNKHAGSL